MDDSSSTSGNCGDCNDERKPGVPPILCNDARGGRQRSRRRSARRRHTRTDAAAPDRTAAIIPEEVASMTSNVITTLPEVVASHIAAVNAFDTEGIVATFADDAYVNDNRREIWGKDAIRKFFAKEFVGDQVTMDVREIVD